MAGAREIRTKIKSVQNTRKVTRALEMVSTSKIRRAQEQMRTMRPYVRSMLGLVGHIARANSEYKHPFTVEREPRRVAYLVISTDRGLCGGLNNNLFRRVLADMREWQAKGATVGVYAVGSKASQFFRRLSDVTSPAMPPRSATGPRWPSWSASSAWRWMPTARAASTACTWRPTCSSTP